MCPKISDEKRQQQKKKIMDGAIEVFREKGYEQTTMKHIRESADVSTGCLYMYFSNKEEIFISILEDEIKKQDMKIDIEESERCWDKLEKYIDNTKDFYNNIRNGIIPIAYEYSISAWRDEERKKFLENRYSIGIDYVKNIIRTGIETKEFMTEVDFDLISNFIITVMEGLNSTVLSLGKEKIKCDEQLDYLKIILKDKLLKK